MKIAEIKQPLILFDGMCNLCSSSVQFIIKRDKKKQFYFTSIQSHLGQQIIQYFQLDFTKAESVLLLEKNNIFIESTAALKIANQLSGFWSILYSFIIIPSFIRNSIYQLIARNRYKWFGKKESCWIPTKEIISRFL